MGKVVGDIREVLLSEDSRMTKKAAKEMLDAVALLEGIIGEQSEEIARLKGRLEERAAAPQPVPQPRTAATLMPPPVAPPRAFPPLRVPGGNSGVTYALVARSSAPEEKKGETKAKVLAAGGKMGAVKVRGVRELKDGGVAIIASSPGDVRKIREAPSFKEAGLRLSNPKLAEPQLLVLEVPTDLTSDKLGEVISNNLQGVASKEEISKVRVVRRLPRKGGNCAVVVEAPSKIRIYLLAEGRVYVGFSSFRIREFEDVIRCYGCGSFGHVLGRCPTGRLCHNCGVSGHTAERCPNATRCRNCSLRGLEASHRVTSMACPCYANECEKRRGRIIG